MRLWKVLQLQCGWERSGMWQPRWWQLSNTCSGVGGIGKVGGRREL
jgi:hypothetical protein